MTDHQSPFANSLFPFVADNLAPHRNPVTCILASLERTLAVCTRTERVEADMVVIRPGVEHWVEINGRAKVLYFDGLAFPLAATLAAHVPREVATLAIDALTSTPGAQEELRAKLTRAREQCSPAVVRAIHAIGHDPMTRMAQSELAKRLRRERTQALRAFKTATGMTFREFKRWTALCAATRLIAEGQLVRTAAIDTGFADTAHLTRTFRTAFGTTPTLATAKRPAVDGQRGSDQATDRDASRSD